MDTINLAKQYWKFKNHEIELILHCRESFLFNTGSTWVKKGNPFDVTMGSFDGAEVSELVGLFILDKLSKLIPKENIGIYRDDGLSVVQGSGPQLDKLRKDISKIFKDMGLGITIETNITETDFLDVHLNLKNGEFKPFHKINNDPLYIHHDSNHPTSIKKQMGSMISKRISKLSSTKEIFDSEKSFFQKALEKSGYKEKIKYFDEKSSLDSKKKRRRCRKILWFNPPFSETVQTNIGKKFLSLIDKHFKNSKLNKYFNKNTLKLSYSCMGNMKTIISAHNRKILSLDSKPNPNSLSKECNCRTGENTCPLEGKCKKKSLIYKAEVKTNRETSTYIGQSSNTFKERFNNHLMSFNNEKYANSTHLSNHVWKLKKSNTSYKISWSIVSETYPYHPTRKKCNLCLLEKVHILTSEATNLLNTRNEIMSKCRHREKHLLSSI